MDKIAVVGEREVLLGFKLAGVSETFECTAEDADEKMNEALSKEGVGILIASQDLYKSFTPKTLKRIEASTKPVVVSIPGKTGATAQGEQSIAMMVKRAIGIELKG
ncbi:MAG: V-type ATP synthase subunit F [Candidatus Micrarchaeota archaeon]